MDLPILIMLVRYINEEELKNRPYGTILLNCENIESCWYKRNPELIQEIWNNSSLRLSADGASNFLATIISQGFQLPHSIVGDLDSITENTKNVFFALVFILYS